MSELEQLNANIIAAKETLQAAKELISTPEKWTKGQFAKNTNGGGVIAFSPDATCWSSLGSLKRANVVLWESAAVYLTQCLPAGFSDVELYNDDPNTTHADIMALFDHAIAKLEATA